MNIEINDKGVVVLSDFNSTQAYKIARKLESDGISFYNELAKKDIDEKLKKAVTFLLESEKKHLDYFSSQLEAAQKENDDTYEEDDIAEYVDSGIFSAVHDISKDADSFRDIRKVIECGIAIEKNSLNFYTALFENTSNDQARAAIQDIITEEKHHLETFMRLL